MVAKQMVRRDKERLLDPSDRRVLVITGANYT